MSQHVRRLHSQSQLTHAGTGEALELVVGSAPSPDMTSVSPEPAVVLHLEPGTVSSPAADPNARPRRLSAFTPSMQEPSSYLRYLHTLRQHWEDMPDLTITYDRLGLYIPTPTARGEMPNLATLFRDKALALPKAILGAVKKGSEACTQDAAHDPAPTEKAAHPKPFRLLHACSGVLRPGVLTLVLSPPGHGKSALLKTLAGRMHNRDELRGLRGDLRWNGLTHSELQALGLNLSKLCAYTDQTDIHQPMLTVRETFAFAVAHSNADTRPLGKPELDQAQKDKVDAMLDMLGLRECADTIVGNAIVRGVSGGQRRRVSVGEMLLGQARALMLDEISTGLDAATTLDIVRAVKHWTRAANGSATVSLLQATPEVVAQFDRILLMREGCIVFDGTQAELRQHLCDLRITPNVDVDLADWCVSFLADPVLVWKRDMIAESKRMKRKLMKIKQRQEQAQHAEEDSSLPQQRPAHVSISQGDVGVTPRALGAFTESIRKPSDTLRPPAQLNAHALTPFAKPDPTVVSAAAVVPVLDPETEVSVVRFHPAEEEDPSESPVDASEAAPMIQLNGNTLAVPGAHAAAQPDQKSYVPPAGAEWSAAPTPAISPAHGADATDPAGKSLGRIVNSRGIPLTTAALRKAFEQSVYFTAVRTELSLAKDPATCPTQFRAASAVHPVTRAQYYQQESWSFWHHQRLNLWRESVFYWRQPRMFVVRWTMSVILALIVGSLYYQVDPNKFTLKVGLLNLSLLIMALNNLPAVSLATQLKHVVWKQMDAGFYGATSYVLSVVSVAVPISLCDSLLFGTIVYFMTGLALDAGCYFFFVLMLLLMCMIVATILRLYGFALTNAAVAAALAAPTITVLNIFGGFLITADKVPDWLIWAFWLSPFSWAVRSVAQNEFHHSRYDVPTNDGSPGTLGDEYLRVYEIDTRRDLYWAGVVYMFGLYLFLTAAATLALHCSRAWPSRGTKRNQDAEALQEEERLFAEAAAAGVTSPSQLPAMPPPDAPQSTAVHEVRLGSGMSSMALPLQRQETELSFTPINLAFRDLCYYVPIQVEDPDTKKKTTVEKQLLRSISGFARAGELTALMGSSGAGKTTLMDVIAGRKTSGRITGDILVNGHKQQFPAFRRRAGYAEQMDNHVGTQTVRESIAFSAALRLPAYVSGPVRDRFVAQIIDDLELTAIADRQVGDINIPGLSPSELKRVTIGVELAANPNILFLDEPTSGLDSRAALIVMRVVRKIASSGRAVICTIHQPSSELFMCFDRLLLLKSGGRTAFFGQLGDEGTELIKYFTTAPINKISDKYVQPQKPRGRNPADWMLDVIGAGTHVDHSKVPPYEEVYKLSDLHETNQRELEAVCVPSAQRPSAQPGYQTAYASSSMRQIRYVLSRLFVHYWRDLSYYGIKIQSMLVLGLLLGLVYRAIDDTVEAGLMSKLAVMNLSCGFVGLIHCFAALPVILRLRDTFYREQASQTYAAWVHAVCLALVEIPFIFLSMCIFLLPFYWLVEFEADAQLFFRFLLVVSLMALTFAYLGHCLASALPNISLAATVQGAIVAVFFLFAGIYIRRGNMPDYWSWFYYIDPIPKGFVVLSIEQFECVDPPGVRACPRVNSVQYGGDITQWEFVQRYIASGGGDWEGRYLGWIVCSIAVIFIASLIVITKVSHVKR